MPQKNYFDSDWRERLKDYPHSSEYKENLQLLKREIDQTLPQEKPSKKLVFVFMGIPGSGKSTIAQLIKRSIHPSVIIRSDWIFFEKLRDQIADDYYKAYVYQEDLARRYLKEGYSVVMDDNNRTVRNRTEVYRWAEASNAQPVLLCIDVDVETAARRESIKGEEKVTKEERIAALTAFQSQVEIPNSTEKVKLIKIDGRASLEQITTQIKEEITCSTT